MTTSPDESEEPAKAGGASPIADEPALEKIGAILKGARDRQGLSVREVHELTGISPAVLYGYEAGKTRPGAREIALLCKALKVTPNALLFGKEDPFGAPATDPASRLASITSDGKLSLIAALLLMPMVMATMDFEDRRTLFAVALALVQAKHPQAGQKVTQAMDAFDAAMLTRGITWEGLGRLSDQQRQDLMSDMQTALGESIDKKTGEA